MAMLVTSYLLGHWLWITYICYFILEHNKLYYIFLSISAAMAFIQQWAYLAVRCTDPGTDAQCLCNLDKDGESIAHQSRIIQRDEEILAELLKDEIKDPK